MISNQSDKISIDLTPEQAKVIRKFLVSDIHSALYDYFDFQDVVSSLTGELHAREVDTHLYARALVYNKVAMTNRPYDRLRCSPLSLDDIDYDYEAILEPGDVQP